MRIGDADTRERVLVLAEIGNNHEGDPAVARDLVRAAADAGAFAIVLECIPAAIAERITELGNIPTLGIGAGQMSRVDSVRIAIDKAKEALGPDVEQLLAGSALASDAFFPFPDGVEAAIAAGARAILQPGGSMRDKDVIAACDARDVPMLFTGTRHFRH